MFGRISIQCLSGVATTTTTIAMAANVNIQPANWPLSGSRCYISSCKPTPYKMVLMCISNVLKMPSIISSLSKTFAAHSFFHHGKKKCSKMKIANGFRWIVVCVVQGQRTVTLVIR